MGSSFIHEMSYFILMYNVMFYVCFNVFISSHILSEYNQNTVPPFCMPTYKRWKFQK